MKANEPNPLIHRNGTKGEAMENELPSGSDALRELTAQRRSRQEAARENWRSLLQELLPSLDSAFTPDDHEVPVPDLLRQHLLRRRIHAIGRNLIASQATVLVLSAGDEEWIQLEGRNAWHFPQHDQGTGTNYRPADSAEPIQMLEEARTTGADYLLVPAPAYWWLEQYPDFRAHLDTNYQKHWDDANCILYELTAPVQNDLADLTKLLQYRLSIRRIRTIVQALLPSNTTVAVVSKGDDELLRFAGRAAFHFPQDEQGRYSGYYPANSTEATQLLDAARSRGAEYLLLPAAAFWWLQHYAGFREHLESCYDQYWKDDNCIIYELGKPQQEEHRLLGSFADRIIQLREQVETHLVQTHETILALDNQLSEMNRQIAVQLSTVSANAITKQELSRRLEAEYQRTSEIATSLASLEQRHKGLHDHVTKQASQLRQSKALSEELERRLSVEEATRAEAAQRLKEELAMSIQVEKDRAEEYKQALALQDKKLVDLRQQFITQTAQWKQCAAFGQELERRLAAEEKLRKETTQKHRDELQKWMATEEGRVKDVFQSLAAHDQMLTELRQQTSAQSAEGKQSVDLSKEIERRLAAEEAKTKETAQTLANLAARCKPRQRPLAKGFAEGNPDQALGYCSDVANPTNSPTAPIDFANLIYGMEQAVKERQKAYLPFFQGRNRVVDLACGRGEFLQLLLADGRRATGVEADATLVKQLQTKGLEVVQADPIAYLGSQPAGSLDGLFTPRLIEYCTVEQLAQFLVTVRSRLRRGGILVAETPNPEVFEAWKTFALEGTIRRPVFPQLILYLCQQAGFPSAKIFYPNAGGFTQMEYYTATEYALVALV